MEKGARATTRPAGGRFVPVMSARVRSAGQTVARHLVLAYRPGWQSLDDLNAIAGHVGDIDPTIATFIVPTTHRNLVTRKRAAERPTLIVSPGRMRVFKPLRGKVYQGWPIPKIEEVRRLQAAGVPVPKTEILTPDLRLDPDDWGKFVIVKPTDILTSSHGEGVQLMRTHRVRYTPPRDYPEGHPGRRGPMMVQQFVDTGTRLRSHRVTTLFGEPISAIVHTSLAPRVDLAAPDTDIETAAVAIQSAGGSRETEFLADPEILSLAKAAHEALPEIPLKGCDILRDVVTGKLYVIELNCGGNTWHFSSKFLAERRKKLGPEFELRRRQQFDAFRTAARVLVERTNAEAE